MGSSIVDFYNKKTILLTGFTGFLGQVIVEKLLRCCDVSMIYVLIRNKKGKSWENRVNEIFKSPLFDLVRKQKPEFMKKIKGVVGDCCLHNLGLNQNDIKIIKETVNIVFHSAAVVKFDEKLVTALNINVRATQYLMNICKEIKHIEAFVYISTAYSNCNQSEIDEVFYKPKVSATKMLNLLDSMDEDLLNGITNDLIKGFPNTYTFTKNLAEDLINNFSDNLPVIIFRPPIVMPTCKEPVSGWINNLYGPIGLMYGISMGAIHVFTLDKEKEANLVPVDYVVSCLLACPWDKAHNSNQSIPIYNFLPKKSNTITWGRFMEENLAAAETFPTSTCYWYYAFETTNDPMKTTILHFFYHTLPAIFVDMILIIIGHKFRLLKLYKTVYRLNFLLAPFILQKWTWYDNNVVQLWKNMSREDQEMFCFNMENLDWKKYIWSSLRGMRCYIAKDNPSTIEYSLKRQKVLKIVHYIFTYSVKGLVIVLLGLIFIRFYFSVLFPMLESLV